MKNPLLFGHLVRFCLENPVRVCFFHDKRYATMVEPLVAPKAPGHCGRVLMAEKGKQKANKGGREGAACDR
jgi:hypothetical protein